MKKKRILLSAYSCYPNSGSEPGNGWNWATHLAEAGMDVTVLTMWEGKDRIDEEMKARPRPGLTFHVVDVPLSKIRHSTGLHYALWQWYAYRRAKQLGGDQAFDLAHHVTLSSIHVPSQLWRLGIPVIFGPVGGGQTVPTKLMAYLGADAQKKERIRTAITSLLPYSPLHRKWLRRMHKVLVTNAETAEIASRAGANVMTYFDPGIAQEYLAPQARQFANESGPVRLPWVGRMLPRKALGLTLDIMSKTPPYLTLTLIGGGLPEATLQSMIRSRDLQDRVMLSGGAIPWNQVRQTYLEHDALLFTSLRDSCAAQLLEAMATGLPVITLDLHGGGLMVPDDAGIKIPVLDMQQTVQAGADAVRRFAEMSNAERSAMSEAGLAFAQTMTWPNRAKFGVQLYEQALADRSS